MDTLAKPRTPRPGHQSPAARASLAALLIAAALPGCAKELWEVSSVPLSIEILDAEFGLARGGLRPDQIPALPEPKHLRPCCAFGSGFGVKVGPLPVPGVRLVNTLGRDDLGSHEYDGGLPLKGGIDLDSFRSGERNGLVFTCQGGFVDTDHTIFLVSWVGRHIETGGTLPLRDEGGARRILLRPFDPELLRDHGLRKVAVMLSQWLAYQMSVWHEIATWYGWSSLRAFPEIASAFSPEDLYSNLLGIKLAGAVIYDRKARSEDIYNDSMTGAARFVLGLLGAQPADVGQSAAFHVDGVWWDSKAKLPAKSHTLRRNFDTGPKLTPWRVTDMDGTAPPDVEEACGDSHPHRFWLDLDDIPLAEYATLEIDVSDALLKSGFPMPEERQRPILQTDFPWVIEQIRAENAAEFGPHADSPHLRGVPPDPMPAGSTRASAPTR